MNLFNFSKLSFIVSVEIVTCPSPIPDRLNCLFLNIDPILHSWHNCPHFDVVLNTLKSPAFLYLFVWCVCVHTSVKVRKGGQRTTIGTWFSPSTLQGQRSPLQPSLCPHPPLPPARYFVLFNELTNLICQDFIECFCNSAHEGCICVHHGLKDFFLSCLLFVWHLYNSLIKQVDEHSVLFDFLEEIIKIIDSPAF